MPAPAALRPTSAWPVRWPVTGRGPAHALAGALLASLLLLTAPAAVQAARVTVAAPQGEAATIGDFRLAFDQDVVALGEARQADPATVVCEPGAAAAGSGRWEDARNWRFVFRQTLPAGTRCTARLREQWRPLDGALAGPAEFRFSTGGPAVASVRPWPGSEIEEDQHFILELTGPASEASVRAHAGCEIEGLGERIPVRVLAGAERDALLKSQRMTRQAERVVVLACQRPLPTAGKVRLVWGKGIASQAQPALRTSEDQRFNWKVREAFTADFSCERERAQAPCLPLRPLTLRFSSAVARSVAAQARLEPRDGGKPIAPHFARDDTAQQVGGVTFAAPLPENAAFTLKLPPGVRDLTGRPLANAGSFPLAVRTGGAPPLAKFAAAPFGVVELRADPETGPVLPVTLRHVQPDLRTQAATGQVRVLSLQGDAQILQWFRKVQRHHETQLSARELGLPASQWKQTVEEVDERGRPVRRQVDRYVATREVSLLRTEAQARRLDLPALEGGEARPFEVVGIPLPGPGYHVVEVESGRLGAALLDKPQPMYVRAGVLVTNLGVHVKVGAEDALVWVTTLDRGRPVGEAEVAVSDCLGTRLWAGRTDARGMARIAQPLGSRATRCPEGREALFVSARKADAAGVVDTAFVFTDWDRGIEAWRFNVPVSRQTQARLSVHTVFDRTLLRAGETVSMKHFVRVRTARGLALAEPARLPTLMRIVHEGTGEAYTLPLEWRGARSATQSWPIPPAARLGSYRVVLERSGTPPGEPSQWESGSFRVEEFRVPLVDARLGGPRGSVVAPKELALEAQLNYLNGGGMAGAPLRLTAELRPRAVSFPGFEDFSFQPPSAGEAGPWEAREEDADEPAGGRSGRLVADRLALVTSREGAARAVLRELPKVDRASEIVAELSFNDPNGEVQTVSTTVPVWPAGVVVGIQASSWASSRGATAFTVVALDSAGQPVRGQKVEVRGQRTLVHSTRKRMVGGFYAWDHRREVQELGLLCSGTSDEQGRLRCTARLDSAGEVQLVASARDALGHRAEAATSVWVTGQGELWFAQDNDDRIDVLPQQRRVEPGQTARLQVRMPFREATALVTVEREGVMDARVVTLRGSDPTIELPVDASWGPNVYVSVLALRGRIREVPWYSFFSWGWRQPLEWARSFWHEGREYRPPTAMVDLARPAFKLGVAQLEVGLQAHTLQVQVTPEQPRYGVRDKARVRVRVTQGGEPVAGAEVAFAAVDEGLLALRENDSWDLLHAMMRKREWGVQTSTGQGEIIGRRHYGRKAVAAGGGGGRGGTRELFDTLLLWAPRVSLDARGEAVVEVPLNDSLTSFRLVAVADAGTQTFGTGSASIAVTQDLQLLAGLPPLVREGDRYRALLTLRNTTARPMEVRVTLRGTVARGAPGSSAAAPGLARAPLELAPQLVRVAAGAAAEVGWDVEVPAEADSIAWEAAATAAGARDRLRVTQLVASAVPVRVVQATLQQLDGSASTPVTAPADALRAGSPGVARGGLAVSLRPSLGGTLPGVRRYFESYPYSCLEQQASRAIGLRDATRWAALMRNLPTYLDRDGLASYFPLGAEEPARGSDRLTAYLLAAADEAGFQVPAAERQRMLDGLAGFVEGRFERASWAPRADLEVRKLAALEALARHGRAQPRMLGSISLTPGQWPTAAVIDWLGLLRRVDTIPQRAARMQEAQQILRSRLAWSGTTLRFSGEDTDAWWWLMDSADGNAARLLLAVLDEPSWRDDVPRLALGTLARQRQGAWQTTTANVWGTLALDRFATVFENVRVAGRTTAAAGGAPQVLDWARAPAGGTLQLPWPAGAGTLKVSHEGAGRPWMTTQALAAVPPQGPVRAGYAVTRSLEAVQRQQEGRWSRGDVVRVRVEIEATADMNWVVLSDPVPGGATILGSGLGRDSALAAGGERNRGAAWVAHDERGFEAFRRYFGFLPRGRHVVEYTVRLNNPGRFQLPATRVEAMYAPENFGETPNAALEVAP